MISSPFTRFVNFVTDSFSSVSEKDITRELLLQFQQTPSTKSQISNPPFDIRQELFNYAYSLGSMLTDGHKARAEFVSSSLEYAFLGYPDEVKKEGYD